jgi:predicted DNA binding CopG/RHH family protein
MSNKKRKLKEIKDYDSSETEPMINKKKALRFEDLGLTLPPTPPTQVVSIRLPSGLLNDLRAIGSKRDIPYQALMKVLLVEGVETLKKRRIA